MFGRTVLGVDGAPFEAALTAYAVTSQGDAPLEWHAHFAGARHRLTDWVSRTGCEAATSAGRAHHQQERLSQGPRGRCPGREYLITRARSPHPSG